MSKLTDKAVRDFLDDLENFGHHYGLELCHEMAPDLANEVLRLRKEIRKLKREKGGRQ